MHSSIPLKPGSYALRIFLANKQNIKVGSLGEQEFFPGEYIYLGSALGPGGLRARLGRHLRGDGRHHWHIDWLRAEAVVTGYYFLVTDRRLECQWSQALMEYPNVRIPVPRFGASDCRGMKNSCPAHLFRLEPGRYQESIQKKLSKASGLEVIYCQFTSDSQAGMGYIE